MDDLGVPGYPHLWKPPYEGMIIELPDSFYSISLMTGPSREHGTSSWENTLAHGWLTRRGTLARCSGLGFQYWKPWWLGDPHGSLILGKPWETPKWGNLFDLHVWHSKNSVLRIPVDQCRLLPELVGLSTSLPDPQAGVLPHWPGRALAVLQIRAGPQICRFLFIYSDLFRHELFL